MKTSEVLILLAVVIIGGTIANLIAAKIIGDQIQASGKDSAFGRLLGL